ncbi:MAG TPA: hypothetical protein VNS12_06405, partial [Pelagibacterium sp.]|uniref:hypothetical protein n=1 Tax=Pelagibacterium sp. TaxID=1967288 RepID=UPI002BB7F182
DRTERVYLLEKRAPIKQQVSTIQINQIRKNNRPPATFPFPNKITMSNSGRPLLSVNFQLLKLWHKLVSSGLANRQKRLPSFMKPASVVARSAPRHQRLWYIGLSYQPVNT